jgi:hypothetical protein
MEARNTMAKHIRGKKKKRKKKLKTIALKIF